MKKNNDYKEWLTDLKSRIRQSQIKAAIAVNSALIEFYWDLGKMISEKEAVWGGKLVEQVAKDLKEEFPDMQGLSRSNLFNAQKFYKFYNAQLVQQPVALIQNADNREIDSVQQPVGLIGQQAVAQLQVIDSKGNTIRQQVVDELGNHPIFQIPWGHHIQIFMRFNSGLI
jgi:hypothetical protein